ncbi:hypothetical protein ACS2MN_07690 [Bacillus cereus group sp. BceL062]|uniref:hypothetical protein n=1 Tax=Bacillus cereus group sp. BceL062 TaxID=3445166 RepID=UPI003F234018
MENKERKKLVSDFIIQRGLFIEVVFVAFFLALGTALIANYLSSESAGINMGILGIAGVVLVLVSLLYILFIRVKNRSLNTEVKAVVLFNKKDKKIIPVFNYSFGTDISTTLSSVFLENRALEAGWKKEALDDGRNDIETLVAKVESKEKSVSKVLLIEATEYYLLDMLSTHLTDYFAKQEELKQELQEYDRDNLQPLLKNRILDLLTRPIEEREVFLDLDEKEKKKVASIYKVEDGNKVLVRMYYNGAEYNRFDLVLPKKSRIKRLDIGMLEIITKKAIIKFEIGFDGHSASISKRFKTFYTDQEVDELLGYSVNMKVSGKLKLSALLSVNGWNYYNWIDTFIKRLEKKSSWKLFLDRIDWEKEESKIHMRYIQNYRFRKMEEEKSKVKSQTIETSKVMDKIEDNSMDENEDNSMDENEDNSMDENEDNSMNENEDNSMDENDKLNAHKEKAPIA